MPQFVCRLATSTGAVLDRECEAEDAAALRQQLEHDGYHVFGIRPKAAGLRLPIVLPRRRRVSRKTLLAFTQELLALLRAGLPIMAILDLLIGRATHPNLRETLQAVREDVRGGASLSASTARHPRIFPPLFVASVRAGEQSGALVATLGRFLITLKHFLALRRKVYNALMYPSALVVITGGVILFLLTFVVPTFSRIYADFGASLPLPTQALMATTERIRHDWPLLLAVLLAAGVYFAWWRRTPGGRATLDRLSLKLPWAGPVLHRYALAAFCRSLAAVLGGGTPVVPALEVAAAAVSNVHVASRLRTAIPLVVGGSSLARALEQTGVATPMMVEMVAVGETTGGLEEMLGHAADAANEEIDLRLSSMAALLEPVIMAAMGLVVATIVIVIYLPLFHLVSIVR
ncbi:MAG: type II secretion system F family protein [candidate division NC10 bacterium]|nr:type II secretion system F family protein [candidate division NC10 bacterium]MBI4413043.1 type II secretion system F family protein [candidate division NC10 bacterium]